MIEQGLSEVLLGTLNGLGSIIGIIGTIAYPYLVKHTGLVRTGVIGFWSEFSMLTLCLVSLFMPGTAFTAFQDFTLGACHLYQTSNNTLTTDPMPVPCSNSKLSVLLLVIGITLNRFGNFLRIKILLHLAFLIIIFSGLWLADLTVNQLQQERVPEKIRGRVGGTQHSLNQFFDLLRYAFIICLPRMPQFGYHVFISVLSVFSASLIYTIWSCSSASHLVSPATDIEMRVVNADLAEHYEANLGEKITFMDDADESKDKDDSKT